MTGGVCKYDSIASDSVCDMNEEQCQKTVVLAISESMLDRRDRKRTRIVCMRMRPQVLLL